LPPLYGKLQGGQRNASINNQGELRGLRAGNVVVTLDMNGTLVTQNVTVIDTARDCKDYVVGEYTAVRDRIVRKDSARERQGNEYHDFLRQTSPTNYTASTMRKTELP
jgi:hypothetical protein